MPIKRAYLSEQEPYTYPLLTLFKWAFEKKQMLVITFYTWHAEVFVLDNPSIVIQTNPSRSIPGLFMIFLRVHAIEQKRRAMNVKADLIFNADHSFYQVFEFNDCGIWAYLASPQDILSEFWDFSSSFVVATRNAVFSCCNRMYTLSVYGFPYNSLFRPMNILLEHADASVSLNVHIPSNTRLARFMSSIYLIPDWLISSPTQLRKLIKLSSHVSIKAGKEENRKIALQIAEILNQHYTAHF